MSLAEFPWTISNSFFVKYRLSWALSASSWRTLENRLGYMITQSASLRCVKTLRPPEATFVNLVQCSRTFGTESLLKNLQVVRQPKFEKAVAFSPTHRLTAARRPWAHFEIIIRMRLLCVDFFTRSIHQSALNFSTRQALLQSFQLPL